MKTVTLMGLSSRHIQVYLFVKTKIRLIDFIARSFHKGIIRIWLVRRDPLATHSIPVALMTTLGGFYNEILVTES